MAETSCVALRAQSKTQHQPWRIRHCCFASKGTFENLTCGQARCPIQRQTGGLRYW